MGERRLVIFSPGVTRYDLPPPTRADEGVTLCRSWEETVAILETIHGGNARAAVFPASAMQLAAE